MPASEKQSSSTCAGPSSSYPALLTVGVSEESRLPLRRVVEEFGWDLFGTDGIQSAIESLQAMRFAVVVCEQNLPDGNWRLFLEEITGLAYRPNVIVVSRFADDRLWAEVLNLGAYDLLMLPFDAHEVRRVVSLAWESKCREAAARTAVRKPVGSEPPRQSAVQAAQAAYGD